MWMHCASSPSVCGLMKHWMRIIEPEIRVSVQLGRVPPGSLAHTPEALLMVPNLLTACLLAVGLIGSAQASCEGSRRLQRLYDSTGGKDWLKQEAGWDGSQHDPSLCGCDFYGVSSLSGGVSVFSTSGKISSGRPVVAPKIRSGTSCPHRGAPRWPTWLTSRS
jgi:hypothetical protein